MVAALLSLIFNLLHPRTGEYDNVEAELELVSGSDIWLFDHFMLALSLAFLFVGLLAIASYLERGGASTWGRIARAGAVAGVVVGYITIAVDGMAMKRIADEWAVDESNLAAAHAVAEVSLALFTALIGSLTGFTPLLFGLALLNSDAFPRAHAWLALAGGAVGMGTGAIQFLTGPSPLVTNGLFTVGSLITTIWVFLAGWHLWRSVDTGGDGGVAGASRGLT